MSSYVVWWVIHLNQTWSWWRISRLSSHRQKWRAIIIDIRERKVNNRSCTATSTTNQRSAYLLWYMIWCVCLIISLFIYLFSSISLCNSVEKSKWFKTALMQLVQILVLIMSRKHVTRLMWWEGRRSSSATLNFLIWFIDLSSSSSSLLVVNPQQ